MIYDSAFMGLMGVTPPAATPAIITLSPHDPGDLGTAPKGWSTQVSAPTLTQIKWRVGIDGAKTINFAFGTPGQTAVSNYNHGDVINFTGYGTGFTLVKDVSGPNTFLAQGSNGSTLVIIGKETKVSDVRYTIAGSGGTGPIAYTVVNLTAGVTTINATFTIAGDSLVVKNLDETAGDTSGAVLFSGATTRSITLAPKNPGDLGTAPANWTTTANALNLPQVKWAVFDANFNSAMEWQIVSVTNNSVSITCSFTKVGDRLVVKSLDDLVEDVSGQVAFSVVPKTISLSPNAPGDLGTAPKNWTTTANVSGLPQVKWAVFDANFNSSMTWQVVNVTNGTASITCTFNQAGERLIVKSLDDTVEIVSSQVSFSTVTVPPTISDDLAFAKAWLAPLTNGVNIEREAGGGRDAAYFSRLKANGISHVRFFVPTKASWGFASNDTLKYYFDSIAAASSVGMPSHIDAQDVCEPGDLQDSGTNGYVKRFGEQFAARNFDPRLVLLGAVQEYAYMDNAFYEPFRNNYHNILRALCPKHIIVDNSANWGDPYTLINGTFTLNADKRKIYQWHSYPYDADDLQSMTNLGNDLKDWADTNNVPVYCGEIGLGPANGDRSREFNRFNDVIYAAAHGFGHQRPTHWTITNGSFWRFNPSDSYDLKTEFVDALKEGNTFIKTQSYYNANPGGSAGTGGQVPATPGIVTNVDALFRGQSNAYLADQYGAPTRLKETFDNLTGITMNVISRKETTNNTLHSGTYSFWDNPYNSEGRWLSAPGTPPDQDYTTSPSTWTSNGPMTETVAAVTAYVSSNQDVPLIDIRLHWEYDLGVFDGNANTAYREGTWEITKRIMAARPKKAGRSMHLYAYCPYQGGGTNNLDNMMVSWLSDIADSSRDVLLACGNMMDGQPNTQYDAGGDFSHWGDQSAPRIYPRIAFRLAKEVYRRGWTGTSINLDDCPSMGPYISSVTRAGSSANVNVVADKGTGLVQGIDGVDWGAFTISNTNGTINATGGAITGNNTISVDFGSALPNTGSEKFGHCYFPNFRRKQIIRDNWHSIRPAKYAAVPNIAVVEFPLQRTTSLISF